MSRERFGPYSWAADNNQANLEKHGWSFQSASIALEHGRPVPGNTRADGRDERIASLNGETIKVVSEQRGDETQIISAHRNSNLAREYDAKAAEHGVTKNTEDSADFAAWRRLDERQYRRAKPEFDIQREKQQDRAKELERRTDIGQEQRAQLQAQQTERHRQQAVQDRQPRLERDAKERAHLAQQQSRTGERQQGKTQQQPRRYDPQARREAARQRALDEAKQQSAVQDHDRKRGR